MILPLRPVIVLLGLMHLAGFVGLQWSWLRPLFEQLIAFNLIGTALLLLCFHTDWNRAFAAFGGGAFLIGFWIEWLGVHTGRIFGRYAYGPALGYAWDGIPLLIGLNWFLLTYVCGGLVFQRLGPSWASIGLGALLMVGLDYLIEPVAIRHQMWYWFGEVVPLQNYLAWLGVSLVLMYLFIKLPFRKENPLAPWILLFQALFFAAHNISYFF
ncbi:MAG: hypothetical protein OHK0053_19650 [Microscillaceae bacterium]